MEFLITQSQLNYILKESRKDDDFSTSLRRMHAFTVNMVNKVMRVYDINLKMLLTWGTSIAGLMMPLNEFIKSGNLRLSENERYLILAGVAFSIFYEGKRGMTKILNKIKEEGLEDVFDIAYLKATDLKESFSNFLRSTRVITSQLFEIISYAFLIPIITDIQSYVQGSVDLKETATLIAERLLASGLILISKEMLINCMKKILKRFQ